MLGAMAACSGDGSATAMGPSTPSRLSDYLGVAYQVSADDALQAFDDQQRAAQDFIAQCMRDQGFDYTPIPTVTAFTGGDFRPDDRDWVAQWGYGGIDHPKRAEQLAAAAQGPSDPNNDYVASLSPAELQEYNRALFGTATQPGTTTVSSDGSTVATGDDMTYRWEDAGCYGAAEHDADQKNPERRLATSDDFKPLFDAIDRFNAAPIPGMADADAAWSSCMVGAGYPGLAVQSDARSNFYAATLNALSSGPDANSPDSAAFRAAADVEVALAPADLDCRESTDYQAKQQAAQLAAEAAFVQDHLSDLKAFKTATEQGK
jgi:hypothetical protein